MGSIKSSARSIISCQLPIPKGIDLGDQKKEYGCGAHGNRSGEQGRLRRSAPVGEGGRGAADD